MARMREIVVRYLSPWAGVVKVRHQHEGVFSSSGLHHVSVDSLEHLQCVLWSWLAVSAKGHSEGGCAWRHLQWIPVRQPSLFSSRLSRYLERTFRRNWASRYPVVICQSVLIL